MLKIKENVDLKELGKEFNLELYEYEESGLRYESLMLDNDSTQIVVLDEIDNEPIGIITNPEEYAIGYDAWDKIYDLIKADVVEKVEDK
ncbi:MAG TPA: hypothetical protein IAB45_03430 [Candidatus Onthousia faecavium]|nr:hypothetical protein [Candidatus Onthousia faecavium]